MGTVGQWDRRQAKGYDPRGSGEMHRPPVPVPALVRSLIAFH
jgi:hypothetical protein